MKKESVYVDFTTRRLLFLPLLEMRGRERIISRSQLVVKTTKLLRRSTKEDEKTGKNEDGRRRLKNGLLSRKSFQTHFVSHTEKKTFLILMNSTKSQDKSRRKSFSVRRHIELKNTTVASSQVLAFKESSDPSSSERQHQR